METLQNLCKVRKWYFDRIPPLDSNSDYKEFERSITLKLVKVYTLEFTREHKSEFIG